LSKAKQRTIEIEIYDQKYSLVLKTHVEESEVRRLADDVDTRMREIAAGANTADSLKVAILTALHLAQDYGELKGKYDRRAEECIRALDEVLKK
jgi:cell division protein ZapA